MTSPSINSEKTFNKKLHNIIRKNVSQFKEIYDRTKSVDDMLCLIIDELERIELEVAQYARIFMKQSQMTASHALIQDNMEKTALLLTLKNRISTSDISKMTPLST
jgi:hypothetical protein